MGDYKLGVVLRAMGAGLLALGSKAAMIAKSGGGLSGLAKGAGLLAVGGGAAAAVTSRPGGQPESPLPEGRSC
ncbi:g10742 [Coccomyxa elongata]